MKKNKFATLLLLILIIILIRSKLNSSAIPLTSSTGTDYYGSSPTMMRGIGGAPSPLGNADSGIISNTMMQKEVAPTDTSNRVVIQTSYLSLLVKDVRSSTDQILTYTKQIGGFMVNTYFNNPGETPSGTVSIRIPTSQLNPALKYFRDLSLNVVSENLEGDDVTDQFVDNQARLATLNKTKTKFEDILEKATKIEDILNVQRELINLQSQIDAIQGQLQYMQKSADFTKITIYLSTDEFSLPYAPHDAWRPEVIFKQAVRSVVQTFRDIGTWIIWIGVYAIFWVPALIVLLIIKKKLSR